MERVVANHSRIHWGANLRKCGIGSLWWIRLPIGIMIPCDAPPHSLKYSNAGSKMKTMEVGIRVRFLVRNISRVEGRVGAPRWGLGWVISASIIHMDLHKPNNKLVSA